MNIQYLTNDKGERISVFVPFQELRRKLQEAELTQRYRNALTDIQLFKEGKLKTYSAKDLLDEL
jgi:hypothetical protein